MLGIQSKITKYLKKQGNSTHNEKFSQTKVYPEMT